MVLAKDRGNAFAQLLLGRAALASGQHQQAIDAFKAYLAVTRQRRGPPLACARALAPGRPGSCARRGGSRTGDRSPHGAGHFAESWTAVLGGRKDEGIKVLRDAAERDAENPALGVELADLLTDARRYTEAEAEYRRVIAVRPRDSRALLGLGLVLGATDRSADALEPLNQAVEAAPRNSEARFARAEVLERLGKVAEAKEDYARVAAEAERPDIRRVAALKVKEMK